MFFLSSFVPVPQVQGHKLAHTTPEEILRSISLIDSFKEIKNDSFFISTYEVWFRMPMDHQHPERGYFPLRVYYSHKDFSSPMLMILDGYTMYTSHSHELSHILNSNQITIEHRFFSHSRPTDSIPWEYLNIRQAAADQHAVIQAFKPFYTHKWVSTGISKSGQTTIFHRRFYPQDVNVSVPYVAPLNFSNADPRIHRFLSSVGTPKCREKLRKFQYLLFERKQSLFPIFKELVKAKGWKFSMGLERAYDLSVLESEFSFWQWGGDCNTIPDAKANDKQIFDYWKSLNAFTFFEEKAIDRVRPFFYQAMNQIGMYSYDVKPFRKYLKDTRDITFDFTMPTGHKVSYDPKAMQDIHHWLDINGNYMLYIYGGNDPWTATSVVTSRATNAVKMVNPGGSHATRIKSFPLAMQDSIYKVLGSWLEMNLPVNRP
ncbi:S28 family serine protease [Porphyromonas pogonae]|nr:S28 family serine protease [Porphyromonas pogonae]